MKKAHRKQQNAQRTPSSKAMRMMNIYQTQAMEKFHTKPEHTALVSSGPWTGAGTGLIVTLRTPHTIWGGELPTAVLGMHLLRTWIFPGNSSLAEQHRTHQVLGGLSVPHARPQKDLQGWGTFCSQPLEPSSPQTPQGQQGSVFDNGKQGMSPDAQSAGAERQRPLF